MAVGVHSEALVSPAADTGPRPFLSHLHRLETEHHPRLDGRRDETRR